MMPYNKFVYGPIVNLRTKKIYIFKYSDSIHYSLHHSQLYVIYKSKQ